MRHAAAGPRKWLVEQRDIVTQAGTMSILLNASGSKLMVDAGRC